MKTFTDNAGRSWNVSVTVDAVKRVKSLLDIDLTEAAGGKLIHELAAVMYYHGNVRDLLQIPNYHPTLAEIITYPAEQLCEQLE